MAIGAHEGQRRLEAELRARHHLPPGAQLPYPAAAEERQLLADLVHLPDETDPFRWLLSERGEQVALIALRRSLRLVHATATGRHRASQQGWPGAIGFHAALFPGAGDPAVASLPAVQQLRVLRDGTSARPTSPAGELGADPWRLLQDLLVLPEEADPLGWLRQQRAEAIAMLAVEELLEQNRPSSTLQVGPSVRTPHRLRPPRAPHGVAMAVDEFVLGDVGFRFAARLRLSAGSRSQPRDERLRLLWPGFTVVRDDLGYRYVQRCAEVSIGRWLWYSQEMLHMAFYPALAPGASRLIFEAHPMILRSLDTTASSRTVSGDALMLGDFTWHVELL